jgi:hypothetical protein
MTNKNEENRDELSESKNDVLDVTSQTIYKVKIILSSRLKDSTIHLSLEDLLIMQELHLDLLKNIQEISRLLRRAMPKASNKRVNRSIASARKLKNKRILTQEPDQKLFLDDLSRLYHTVEKKENRPQKRSGTTQPPKPRKRSGPAKTINKETESSSRKKKDPNIYEILEKNKNNDT